MSDYTEKTMPLKASQQMIASGSGALLVSLFTTPFDVIKVRLQAQLKNRVAKSQFNQIVDHIVCTCLPVKRTLNPNGCSSSSVGFSSRPFSHSCTSTSIGSTTVKAICQGNLHCQLHNPELRSAPKFTSSYDALRKIARHEGPTRLWKGMGTTLVMMVPQTVVYFTAYDQLKMKMGYVEGEKNLVSPLLSGVLARIFAVAAISPIEMVRTKLQSKKGFKYSQVFSVLRHAIQHEGVLSLWRGMGPTLLRDVPFSAFYWVTYEYVKSNNPDPSFQTTFLAGAGSGMIAAFCTTPFDVIKTHKQMDLGELKGAALQNRTKSTFKQIHILYHTQGYKSLFTGFAPRLAKVAPACAIMISVYEHGKTHYRRKNFEQHVEEKKKNSRTFADTD